MYSWGVPALHALAQNHEVIIFDYPGFGNSSFPSDIGPNKTLTLGEVANHVVDFLGALQLPLTPDVLGYAQGGNLAMYIAIHHSTMVNNLVVVESTPYGPYVPTSTLMSSWAPEQAAAFAANSSAILGSLFPRGLMNQGACILIATLMAFEPLGALKPVSDDVLLQYSKTGGACFPEVFDALPMVKNRIMFVHGQQDSVIPVAAAREAADQVSGAWLVVFAEAGHGVPYSHANRLAAVAETFFDTVDEPMNTEVAELSIKGYALPSCA
jgi:pimeloyl-ACP methyl ester carboxylesterase